MEVSEVIEVIPEKDLYRDTPVRLLGYANEVGESLRAIVHVNWVRLSYGVATGYVVADTYDKASKMSKRPFNDVATKNRQVLIASLDTLIWQFLASVAIPGYTINRVCALSLFTLARMTQLPSTTRKWTTVAVGLGCIPFIVKPIDTLVDFGMDKTFRRVFSEEDGVKTI